MKLAKHALLLAAFLLTTTAVSFAKPPAKSIPPEIEHAGVRHDFPHVGQQTWHYVMRSGTKPSVSNASIGFCVGAYEVLQAGTWGANFEAITPKPASFFDIGKDPHSGIRGIKFELDLDDGEVSKIFFTINDVVTPEQVHYSIKSGQIIDRATITGPGCDKIVGPPPGVPCGPIYRDPAVIKWSKKYEQLYGSGTILFGIHGQVIPCSVPDFTKDAFRVTLENPANDKFLELVLPPGTLQPINAETWAFKTEQTRVTVKQKKANGYTTYAIKVKALTKIATLTQTQGIHAKVHFGNEYHELIGDWKGIINRKITLPNKYFEKLPK